MLLLRSGSGLRATRRPGAAANQACGRL